MKRKKDINQVRTSLCFRQFQLDFPLLQTWKTFWRWSEKNVLVLYKRRYQRSKNFFRFQNYYYLVNSCQRIYNIILSNRLRTHTKPFKSEIVLSQVQTVHPYFFRVVKFEGQTKSNQNNTGLTFTVIFYNNLSKTCNIFFLM